MNTHDKSKAVTYSLSSFKSLRMMLAYLSSISSATGLDDDSFAELTAKLAEGVTEFQGECTEEDVEELLNYYARAVVSMRISFLYLALCQYRDLVKNDSLLRHAELDTVLGAMEGSGLLEKMSDFRKSLFHTRLNKSVDQLAEDIMKLCTHNNVGLTKLEELLYDVTERVFCNPEVLFQVSEQELMDGYDQVLTHYDTSPQAVREEHEKYVDSPCVQPRTHQ